MLRGASTLSAAAPLRFRARTVVSALHAAAGVPARATVPTANPTALLPRLGRQFRWKSGWDRRLRPWLQLLRLQWVLGLHAC